MREADRPLLAGELLYAGFRFEQYMNRSNVTYLDIDREFSDGLLVDEWMAYIARQSEAAAARRSERGE